MNIGTTGKSGENMTAAFLRKKGYTVLRRNYQCRFGEIDIIAQKDRILAFVEVKTRRENALVSPAESVNSHKIRRITLAAQDYLEKSGSESGLQPRFDVAQITVFKKKDGTDGYRLNYIANAF